MSSSFTGNGTDFNDYTITDAFAFADEIRTISVNEDDILVSPMM